MIDMSLIKQRMRLLLPLFRFLICTWDNGKRKETVSHLQQTKIKYQITKSRREASVQELNQKSEGSVRNRLIVKCTLQLQPTDHQRSKLREISNLLNANNQKMQMIY
jgi:hypothetical protein